MQVRPIEFQENFARVPVEMARQQHVLQHEPELAQRQVARLAAQEHLLNLSRPVPTTPTEGTIVDPDSEGPSERHEGSARRKRAPGGGQSDARSSAERRITGTRIDLVV